MTIEFVNEPSGLSESTLGALKEEVLHARTNFPNQDRQTSMLALMEEVGELAQAILEGFTEREIVAEALQVAAVALRIAEDE